MYHTIKRGKKRRQGRLLTVCFLLAGLWAAMLWWLLASETGMSEGGAVRLVYRGQEWTLPAGQTGRALLSDLGLELTGEDVASLPLDQVLTAGQLLTVELHQRREENFTLAIPPETEYLPDTNLALGREAVLMAGTPGELRCTALVDYVNGVERSREITHRELLTPAHNTLIARGTQEKEAAWAGSGYLWLPDGQLLTYTHTAQVEATAFSPADAGAPADVGPGTVAVNSDFLQPGTRLYVRSADGSFTYGIAQARASASMTGNRVDLFFPTAQEAASFGRRACTLYILG